MGGRDIEISKIKIIIRELEAQLSIAKAQLAKHPGCSRTHPLTWLQDRLKTLQKGLGILETDIVLLKRKIEENETLSRRPDIVTRSGKLNRAADNVEAWRQSIVEKEARLQELKSQLDQVQKAISEIQPILQGGIIMKIPNKKTQARNNPPAILRAVTF